jgi:hypothetical protein
MGREYDFSKMTGRWNPYAKRVGKQLAPRPPSVGQVAETFSMCRHDVLSGRGAAGRSSILAWFGLFVIGIIFLIMPCFCIFPFTGLAYEDDLVSDYAVWAADAAFQAAIVRKVSQNGATTIVGSMVFAYGHNEDFIIAKRHPAEKPWKPDTSITQWFIIEVHTGNVHGPLTEAEYIEMREKTGVPADLTFTHTVPGD